MLRLELRAICMLCSVYLSAAFPAWEVAFKDGGVIPTSDYSWLWTLTLLISLVNISMSMGICVLFTSVWRGIKNTYHMFTIFTNIYNIYKYTIFPMTSQPFTYQRELIRWALCLLLFSVILTTFHSRGCYTITSSHSPFLVSDRVWKIARTRVKERKLEGFRDPS